MKKFSLMGAALIGIAAIAFVLITEDDVSKRVQDEVQNFKSGVFQAPQEEYGIELDDFAVCTDIIQPNQNLGEILSENGLPYAAIHELAEKSKDIFDVRKIRAGKSYCIMRSTDSTEQVQYFIYEQDPINYIVYDMRDSLDIYRGQKEVVSKPGSAAGTIYNSLWQTMTENNIDPEMAVRLSEIYAWSVDFYRIQKGDQFKVLYEEKFVEGERVGIGEIEGAWFQHRDRDYYAIHYTQDDTIYDYFDQDANSLRKAFLKAPLQFRRVSSRFNRKRFHPILKKRRPHLGTDYAAATGTPIWSIGNGVVVKAKYSRGGGNHVEIRHNGTYTTRYLHMSKFGEGIRAGATVSQGQVIGYVGSTGLATGPHLHFEMIKNGAHVDAMQEEIPPGDPVSEECMASYMQVRDQIVERLDAVQIPVAGAEGI